MSRWCPQADSNCRPCLRRAVLYPLSYGGPGVRHQGYQRFGHPSPRPTTSELRQSGLPGMPVQHFWRNSAP